MNGPTHDPNMEQAVLAACMASRTARDVARKVLSSADFFDIRHERIWDAMRDLDRSGTGVDPSTLLGLLQTRAAASAALLPNLVTWPALPDHVADYAEAVRGWAIRRRLWNQAETVKQKALNPDTDVRTLSSTTVTDFAKIRDLGETADAESVTLREVLDGHDPGYNWLIPGMMERQDRLMLTGNEGGGKSYLMRQLAIMAAAGLDPFDPHQMAPPISVLVIDCENSLNQIRRKIRPVMEFATRYASGGDPGNVNCLVSRRIDITADRELARIHREMDACQPDLVVIGPLYRLSPHAIQTDDEAAPVLAALDTIRDRGAALMIEAHAGHGTGKGERDLRPRGSSALLGWPEFGYGMRTVADGVVDLVAWRGDRDERDWPKRLRHCNDRIRWVPVNAEVLPSSGAWG